MLYRRHDHLHIHAFSDSGMLEIDLTNVLLLTFAHILVAIWWFDGVRIIVLFHVLVYRLIIMLWSRLLVSWYCWNFLFDSLVFHVIITYLCYVIIILLYMLPAIQCCMKGRSILRLTHFVREAVEARWISIMLIRSSDQLTDIFTKAILSKVFILFATSWK